MSQSKLSSKMAARARLRNAGGATKTFELSARALNNLATIQLLARDPSARATIERVLEAERTRLER